MHKLFPQTAIVAYPQGCRNNFGRQGIDHGFAIFPADDSRYFFSMFS
jgi:hypothetical protein